ncbi:MAG: TIGR00725 family protein [Deltaproteobacteria bacterium]|jgi:uncharacterized protein (TIGR00725 family)|nr:TIGR00725 family protein [Deltaproteobacteria bacterium]MBW2504452.1 TIGR00725 family protein [Deltaproteobacteria bacterium]MBW2518975.1 TIGR00725 family protein [Deltaproteobacteria bacterium]
MKARQLIGVIGGSQPTDEGLRLAHEVGQEIAKNGAVTVCGGLGGIMEAAAKGAFEAGGEVVGILPGPDSSGANDFVTLPIATNMGHARNIIIAHSAMALIVVEGEYGTVSEIAIGLKLGKPVFVLPGGQMLSGCTAVTTPRQAVLKALGGGDP